MRTYQYTVFADYYQFYLQDDDVEKGNLGEAWTQDATDRLLAVAPSVVGIGTVRNMDVPVTITIYTTPPSIDMHLWDHITTCSLTIETGRMVVAGCTELFADAARINVKPGTYQLIVCYGALNEISEDGLNGNDRYVISLFPGKEIVPTVLKQRKKHL